MKHVFFPYTSTRSPKKFLHFKGISLPENIVIIIAFIVTTASFAVVAFMFLSQLSGQTQAPEVGVAYVEGFYLDDGSLFRVEVLLSEPVEARKLRNISISINGYTYTFRKPREIASYDDVSIYGFNIFSGLVSKSITYRGEKYDIIVYIDEYNREHVSVEHRGETIVEFEGSSTCKSLEDKLVVECIALLLATESGGELVLDNLPLPVLAQSIGRPVVLYSSKSTDVISKLVVLLPPSTSREFNLVLSLESGDLEVYVEPAVVEYTSTYSAKLVYRVEWKS